MYPSPANDLSGPVHVHDDAPSSKTELLESEFERCPRGECLADLPGFAFSVSLNERMGAVVNELQRRPELPGVIVKADGEVVGVLPRATILELLSRPFGHELFLPRPASTMLNSSAQDVLTLPGRCPIHEAAWNALRRPTERVFEPILVEDDVSEPRLIDVHTLLLAQSRLLAEASQTIERQRDQAEAATLAKSQFLANMSHEIRTPLTAILGFAESMLDTGVDLANVQRGARIIMRNGDHLLQVINDILDISKIEAGKLEVERRTLDLLPLIRDVMTIMGTRADAKGLTLSLEFDGPAPRQIVSDATRLRQVLLNLLNNAIKFTEQGSVKLRLSLAADADPAPQLRFDVLDTGIGMSPDQLSRLFQPFSQADVSTTRRFGGTGLGLSISRQLARMLGGDVSVTSTLNEGSRFTLSIATGAFPLSALVDDPASEYAALIDVAASRRTQDESIAGKILLADDGPDNQLLISGLLRKWGATVTVCDNGRDAVELALEEARNGTPFDCILLDVQMPVMDGCEAAAHLRRVGYAAPIIALTANAMASDREKCLAAGCDDYATKPINRRQLAAQIRKATGTTPASAAAMATPELPPARKLTSRFDDAVLLEQVGGDRSLAVEIVGTLTGQCNVWLQQIESALADDDRKSLRRAAHSVKGAAATTGNNALQIAAADLESSANAEDRERLPVLAAAVRDQISTFVAQLGEYLESQDGVRVPASTTTAST